VTHFDTRFEAFPLGKKYVHLRLGLILAGEAQTKLIAQYLAENHGVRLQRFEHAHEAVDFVQQKRPQLVIADFERFGAAGIYGLADLMEKADAPVILVVRDVSEWEREQFKALGVCAVFEGTFRVSDLGEEVSLALKRRWRIGSSDRLPVVNV
jgi:DNA-binding response OmpR family regulator